MRKLLHVRSTTAADVVGAGLVSFGVGAYSWPAGVIVAGVAVLTASFLAEGKQR